MKRLWWSVHEADSPELVAGPTLEARFAAGHRVGDAAQAFIPGGKLIEPSMGLKAAVSATAEAIETGAPRIYEASFLYEGIFVAVDILERMETGWCLIEVKSTGSVKPTHVQDSAIQRWVLEGLGHAVVRTEVMHLNTQGEGATPESLFIRKDTTTATGNLLSSIPLSVVKFRTVLEGELPEVEAGKHCRQPYVCEFFARCNATPKRHGLHELYRVKAKVLQGLRREGITEIAAIPTDTPLPAIARRQCQSIREGRMVVEPGLAVHLETIQLPAVFIDFEAINPALPPWDTTRPFSTIPVQVSMHSVDESGLTTHTEWLGAAGVDPRTELARVVLHGIEHAATLVAYHASFEKRVIRQLAELLPAEEGRRMLVATERFVDLLPLVRNHVYHPEFLGKFSLKSVIRALLPSLHYGDLEVQSGDVASVQLQHLIVHAQPEPGPARVQRRKDLLAYCERDTLVMVRLYQILCAHLKVRSILSN